MRWTWSPAKDTINKAKHGLPLSLGEVALADPLALSQPDVIHSDRWNTLAAINDIVFFIVHTWPDGEEIGGRIISVRKATSQERKAYENG